MMHRWPRWSSVIGALALFATGAHAQSGSDAAAMSACAGCSGMFLFIVLGFIALNIALLVWVVRDAKSRSMDTPIIWMILVLAMGPLGLLIYVLSRPKGELVACAHCGNKRLQASAKCPHCGNA